MLRYLRIVLQIVSIAVLTLLFLDFTGTIQPIFGWLAKIQLFPAILAMNFVVVVLMLLLTFVFGQLFRKIGWIKQDDLKLNV